MRPNDQTDGLTLLDALRRLEALGFKEQFRVCPDGVVTCGPCGTACPAEGLTVVKMMRTEGVSDPADETAILALACSDCGAQGTLVVPFGPRMGVDSSQVVQLLRFGRDATVPVV